MLRLLRWTRLDREDGQVLPMFAAGLVAMLMMTGIVIDGGNLFQNKQSVQNAADAAALAAGMAISNGTCGLCGAYAGLYAGYNGVSGPNGDVTSAIAASLPPCTGTFSPTSPPAVVPGCYVYPYNGDTSRVEVWLTRKTSNFFGGLMGIGTSSESARAVAKVTTAPTVPFGGNFIYADGDITFAGSSHAEEPVISKNGNLILNGSNPSISSIAALVSVGGYIDTGNGANAGAVGDGPQTSLSGAITAADTTIGLAQALRPLADGTVKIDGEWIRYNSVSGTTIAIKKGQPPCDSPDVFCRGYAAFPANPAAHVSGALVEARIAEVHAALGCKVGSSSIDIANCTQANYIFSVKPPDTTPITFTKPSYDVNQAYAEAAPGPMSTNVCTGALPGGLTGSTLFDNDGTLNWSGKPIVLTSSTWNCTATAPDGSTGQIGFNAVTNTLTVRGLVFFDRDVTIGSNGIKRVVYDTGSAGASIWTSGTLNLQTSICAVPGSSPASSQQSNCDPTSWDPSTNDLGIVAHSFPGSTNNHDVNQAGGDWFQGRLYTDGTFDQQGGAVLQGQIVCVTALFRGSVGVPVPRGSGLPHGFPGLQTVGLVE